MHLTRRSLLAGLGAVATKPAWAGTGPRFATLDHGLAQTLIALGADLAAIAQVPYWDIWTVEPPLPPGVANLGLAREPNMESLARLAPDLILSTPYLEGVRHQLERVAPVESFPIHAVGASPWPNILDATRRLGVLSDREAAADRLIAETDAELARIRDQLTRLRDLPLVPLHFVDSRHVRIYGPNGIIQDTLDRLELRNGWPGPTNGWGFATAGIERLVEIGDARVLVFDPVRPDVEATLAGSPLWQGLPFVRADRVRRFPNVLAFGTLPAATRLARLLEAFERDHA
ncbi:ABC transporter substrate-binding protein [Thalassobaculum sp.]|uniref:ABC transporter substrate-binding protein n=1 Tax=Thalassobaculum sp. TaxID=2022740 RepID=UPI003B5CE6BD